jgi:hypothetical protein
VGDPVNWTYVVTNTGNVDLVGVSVTDDQGVTVTCPQDTLAVGESITCTAPVGTAVAGQYANEGTTTGFFNPLEIEVTDSDLSHYFGSEPAIDIEKATNGEDADTLFGPFIPVGQPVNWTYVVENTGNVALTGVTVVDDQGVTVTCPATTLAVGASMTCTASGIATPGIYVNLGTASGFDPIQAEVTDSDPSHYFGIRTSIAIEKATNGEDADLPTGPYIPIGDAVTWTYVVTNTGNLPLIDVGVVDDQGITVTCPQDTLASGESMTCTAPAGVAVAGQYANVGTVTGTATPPPINGDGEIELPGLAEVTASDPSHYFGFESSITIEKATNGEDADTPTGPSISVGDPVNWTYLVTNTSNVELTNVTVVDDQGVTVSCPETTLAAGATMTCTATGVAVAGQYANVGTVTGLDPLETELTASDPSHYFGIDASIDIEKATNGQDADTPTGPTIPVGDTVTWTYVVTNTGKVALTGVMVVDDQGVTVTCPRTTLAAGETMTCVATGIAVAGQYANNGTAAGFDPSQTIVTDVDPSHYYGKAILPVTGIDADRLGGIGLVLLVLGLVAVLATRRRRPDAN